ncbi:MAG TPA: DNA methylase [Thermoplasmatales archaeon]|nr:DNA methylase [Thermoplasmatales archaeon]
MFKKKHLAQILSKLERYSLPKPDLEQYVTPGDIAADLLWRAYMSGKLEGKIVADLGCGTAVLSIGAALLGAARVYAVEIDDDVIPVAERNIMNADVRNIIDLINTDVSRFHISVDTVVMNPPFGCQREHADRVFLKKAFEIGTSVFSIHLSKPEVRRFIWVFSKEHGFKIVWREIRLFDIPAQFIFHKKKMDRITVDLYQFEKV